MRTPRSERGEPLQLVDHEAAPGVEAGSAAGPGPEVFESFYRRELWGLVTVARALAGDEVAEHVAQEAMMVAHRRWDSVQRMASPVGWVRGVCLRKAVSLVRRRGVEQRLLRRISASVPPGELDMAGSDHWALVRTLPAEQAQAIALHYATDLRVADIAVALGCAQDTVEAHLARGRARLAPLLAESQQVDRMSVDVLLRRKGAQLRSEIRDSVDVERRLAALTKARRRQRLRNGVLATGGAAAALVVAIGTFGSLPVAVQGPLPEDRADRTEESVDMARACRDSDLVECLGGGAVRVSAAGGFRLRVPEGFHQDVRVGDTPAAVILQSDHRAGLAILPDVEPAVPTVGVTGARQLVDWVASRSSFAADDVVPTRVDGRSAWSVSVRTKPGGPWFGGFAPYQDTCNGQQPSCRPLLRSPDGSEIGVWPGMVARYTFVDLDDGRVVALWSWAFEEEVRAMRLNSLLQDSLVIER